MLFCATSSAIAQAPLAVARGTGMSGARMSTRTGECGREGCRETAAKAVPAAREAEASAAYSDGDNDVGSSGSSDELNTSDEDEDDQTEPPDLVSDSDGEDSSGDEHDVVAGMAG